MTEFFKFVIDRMWGIFATVDNIVSFELFGQDIGFFTLCIGFIIIYMVISLLWKGAQG